MKKPTWDELFKSSSPKSKPTWDELMDSSGRQAASSPLPEIKSSIPRPNINSGVSLPKAPSLLEPEQQAAYERSVRAISPATQAPKSTQQQVANQYKSLMKKPPTPTLSADEQASFNRSQAVIDSRLKQSMGPNAGASIAPTVKPTLGQWLGANTKAGIGAFNSGLAGTADMVLPDFLTPKPVQKTLDYYKGKGDQYAQEAARVNQSSNTGMVGSLFQSLVSMAPNAALAVMSGGASLASSAPNAAAATGTLGSAVANTASQMASKPTFWLSASRIVGQEYEDAKKDGASELQAQATGIISGLLQAGVEVSGGIETFGEGAGGVKGWVKTMLDEGKEEVVQGVIENLTRKAMFAHDAPYASLSNPEAVLNPKRAAQEFAGGAIAGGILGGAQSGIAKLASLPRANVQPNAPTPIPRGDAPTQPVAEPLKPATQAETPILRPKGWEDMQPAKAVETPLKADSGAQGATAEPTFGKNTVGAAESAFPRKQKTSKVFSNTYLNSDVFTQAEKNVSSLLVNDSDIKYDVVGEKQSLAEAAERLAHDFEGEVADLPKKAYFDGVDTDTAMGVLEQRLKEARESGNYDEVLRWSKIIQEKGTEAGQRIQAFAKYSRTPENAVIQAQRIVQGVEDTVKAPMKDGKYPDGANPKLWDKVEAETQNVVDMVKKAETKAAEGAAKEVAGGAKTRLPKKLPTPAEMLAKKVESTTKVSSPKKNAISDMVNELFRSAKESPLPERVAAAQRNPVDFLRQAIQEKETFAETWTEAKTILKNKYRDDSEVLGMLDNYFDKGIVPTYSDATLGKSVQAAGKEFGFNLSAPSAKKIQPQRLNELIKSSRGDKEAALKKITDYLVEQTGATGNDAELLAEKTLQKYNQILAQRSESALKNMFRELPKKGQKTAAQKIVELINLGLYDDDSFRDLIKEKNGIPVLTGEDAMKITEYMEKALEYPENSWQSYSWESKAMQIIVDKANATKTEKFKSFLYNNMLGNFRTLISRNAGGNIMLAIPETIREAPTAAIDMLVSNVTGERHRTMPSRAKLKAYGQGFKKGATEQYKDYRHRVSTPMSGEKMDLGIVKPRVFNSKIFHEIDRLVDAGLSMGDRPFYEANYAKRMVELNQIKEMGKLPKDFEGRNFDEVAGMLARVDALDATFQNNGDMPTGFKELKDAIGKIAGESMGVDLLSQSSMPFTRTLGNMFLRGIEYSPFGVVKNVVTTGREAHGGRFNQRRFVDETGRNLIGLGVAAAAGAAVAGGKVVGQLSKDKDERAAQRASGLRPYSVQIGDKWYTYDWIPGVGPTVAAVADASQALKGGEGAVGAVKEASKASINSLLEQQAITQGLKSLVNYGDLASGVGRTIFESGSGQLIPSLLRQTANVTDDYVRETYDPNPIIRQGKNLVSGVPGLRQLLPKRSDVFGEDMLQNQGRGIGQRALESYLLPYGVTEVSDNPIVQEMFRLRDETGSTAQFLRLAKQKVTIDGETIPLPTDAYIKLQQDMGRKSTEILGDVLGSPVYSAMPDADKIKVIESALDYAEGTSIKAQFPDYKIEGWIEKAGSSSLGVADFLMYRHNYNAIEPIKDKDGKTVESATDIYRQALLGDSTISASQKHTIDREIIGNKTIPDYSNKDTFLLSQLTDKQQERFEKYNRGMLTAENYYEIVLAAGKGKTKLEKIERIEALGYSKQQARQIYARILSK